MLRMLAAHPVTAAHPEPAQCPPPPAPRGSAQSAHHHTADAAPPARAAVPSHQRGSRRGPAPSRQMPHGRAAALLAPTAAPHQSNPASSHRPHHHHLLQPPQHQPHRQRPHRQCQRPKPCALPPHEQQRRRLHRWSRHQDRQNQRWRLAAAHRPAQRYAAHAGSVGCRGGSPTSQTTHCGSPTPDAMAQNRRRGWLRYRRPTGCCHHWMPETAGEAPEWWKQLHRGRGHGHDRD